MASGPLTFRTPHIEEIPIAQTKQAPGFAWVAVAKDVDPAKKQLEIAGKKRARNAGLGPTEAQREALTARQQRELERRIRDLNTDGSKDANIPLPKRSDAAGSAARDGKTPNTKKILASGKEFKHYLDDEEAELARTGRVDGIDREEIPVQRASKTPLARRVVRDNTDTPMEESVSTLIPYFAQTAATVATPDETDGDGFELDDDDDDDDLPGFPDQAVIDALLRAPPLTYSSAQRTPSYSPVAPPRTFCDVCGYWGLSRCFKCGAKTCSVECEAIHVADRCLKFYS